MTPKEKADSMIDLYESITEHKRNALACAYNCALEVIESVDREYITIEFQNYWEEVKKEIEKQST